MLVKKIKDKDVIWGIWKIEEATDDLLALLTDKSYTRGISSEKRLVEQTAVRVLLKALAEEEKVIGYSSNGKPYLTDGSYMISISHTKGYAAVVLSASGRVGVDIERFSEKVKKVRSKYVSDKEFVDQDDEIIYLLLLWSGKETIYKALGLVGLDFKEDLFIEKFDLSTSGFFMAREFFSGESINFKIQYLVEQDYVFTLTY